MRRLQLLYFDGACCNLLLLEGVDNCLDVFLCVLHGDGVLLSLQYVVER